MPRPAIDGTTMKGPSRAESPISEISLLDGRESTSSTRIAAKQVQNATSHSNDKLISTRCEATVRPQKNSPVVIARAQAQ